MTKRGAPNLQERLDACAAMVHELRKDAALQDSSLLAGLEDELQSLRDLVTRQDDELRRLFQIVHKFERGTAPEDVLNLIFDHFIGIIPYDRISCAFLSDNGVRVSLFWQRSNLGALQMPEGYSRPVEGSSLMNLFRTGEPRIINDLDAYLTAKPSSDATRRIVAEGGRSNLTCPLFIDERPLGVLFFTSGERNAYRDIHQTLFLQIAQELAIVIDKGRFFQQVVERNQFLLRQVEQLKEATNRDVLTGVLSRAAVMTTLERQIRAAKTFGKMIGVLMVDIDHFKQINDTYGHAVGDMALREFSRRLSSIVRAREYIGRYGGEEFLIVVHDTDQEKLLKAGERFRMAVAATPFELGVERRNVTASFGLALVSSTTRSAEEAASAADKALYEAKRQGRNRVILASASAEV